MITLSRNNGYKMKKTGYLMLVVAGAFLVFGLSVGSFTYLELITIGALIGTGGSTIIKVDILSKRYAEYFNNGDVKTIAEIASELGVKEKFTISNLQFFADRADRKKLKNCENVKFEA